MFFDQWTDLVRVVVVGTLAYAGLILLLRISGKRTLSKMNAFDLVVTVALGSTFATILLSKDVALVEGLTAFALLCLLQYVVATLSVRSAAFRQVIKSEPRLLYYRGDFLRGAMRKERVTEVEVLAAVRSASHGSMSKVDSVVLETDGTFSVLPAGSDDAILRTVNGSPE